MASPTTNRLQFSGEAIPLTIKSLLTGLSMLIYVPAPGQLKGLIDYTLSNLRFPDGTVARYEGNGAELKQPLLFLTIAIWVRILTSSLFSHSPFVELGLGLTFIFVNAWIGYQLSIVMFSRIVTNHGSRLSFSAQLPEYLQWQILIAAPGIASGFFAGILGTGTLTDLLLGLLSFGADVITLWLAGLLYKWLISRVLGGTRTARYTASPLATALALIVAGVSAIFILTIPWVLQLFTKWFCEQIELPVKSSAPSFGSGPSFGGAPPPSGPGYSFGSNAS